jgi:predicted O-methyltransferase YrrM
MLKRIRQTVQEVICRKTDEMDSANQDYSLPEAHGVIDGISRGRVVREGYQRGWGLQFGDLKQKILDDPLYQQAAGNTADRMAHFSEHNRMNIYLLLRFFLARIPFGHIIEFGSFRGGSAIFMATICQKLYPDRLIWALDTFKGMPLTDKRVDAHNGGDFRATSLAEVQEAIAAAGLRNVRLVQGLFQDTATGTLAEAGTIALAHIDCDIKSACNYSRKVVAPHMVEGGYIVFDDATYSSCIGATEAVEEMVQETGVFSEQIWPHFVFRHGLRDTLPG